MLHSVHICYHYRIDYLICFHNGPLFEIFYKIYYTINYIPYNVKKNHPRTNSAPLHISFLPKPKSTVDFDEFTFLNKTFKLSKIGWDNKEVDKLWKYNLHYFDYLLQIETIDNQVDSQKKLIEKN
mgnify:CR=1 FL=1